jgi:hypothetical protein
MPKTQPRAGWRTAAQEHFIYPSRIKHGARYEVPTNPDEGYSIEMKPESIATYEYPHGSFWQSEKGKNLRVEEACAR